MRPSSNEAARALASLLAAAFPDLAADGTGGRASAAASPSATPAGADGMRAIVGAQSVMLTKPAKGPIPPPTPNSRASTMTYTPLPTRSGRVPQLPNPDDVDHSTLLFNEYLNYDWPSDDDEENDPDFNPTSDAFSAGDIWVGQGAASDGMDVQEETGDLSADDDDGETDFSTMEDAWMQDDAAPIFAGDALGPSGFTDDILIDPTASTSALLDPALATVAAKTGRATRGASAAKDKSAASSSKSKGKGKEQPPEIPTLLPPLAVPRKRPRSAAGLAPAANDDPPVVAPTPTANANPPEDEPKKRGRPKMHMDADPVEARKQRKRDAAHQSREKAKAQLERDQARLAHLEVENAALKDRIADLERRVQSRKRLRESEDDDSSVASNSHRRRPPERRHHHHLHDGSSEAGSSTIESSGDESDGTVKSGRVVLPPGGPPGGLSVEALAELSRLLAWASAKAASGAK